MNINTKEYWEGRFAAGDWESKRGRLQTRQFAESQVSRFGLPRDFSGTLLDFGCGLGDAMPIYRGAFPKARLVGFDIAEAAIENCRQVYGSLAEFHAGDHTAVPDVDVIVASNVFEHLSNDREIARHLLTKCRQMFVAVPYRQKLTANSEHVNSYDEESFRSVGDYTCEVFLCRGWSQYGSELWLRTYALNLLRPFLGKPIVTRRRQILFKLKGLAPGAPISI